MRAAGIDVVVGLTHEPEAALFVTQARQLGLNVPMVGFSAWAGPMFTDVAGDAATGVYAAQFWHPDLADARGREWAQRFTARSNLPASEHAIAYYDAMFLFKAAVERAGSFDSVRIAEALKTTTWNGINRLEMDAKHNFSRTVFMTRWNGTSYDNIAKFE
jgi:branched-chain amino acid transport system substrate-binding protein